MLIAVVAYAFTVSISAQGRDTSSEVNNALITFVDEDLSPLCQNFASCFYSARFTPLGTLRTGQADGAMNEGLFMFVVVMGMRQILVVGSIPLFIAGVAVDLLSATAIGIFLGTVAITKVPVHTADYSHDLHGSAALGREFATVATSGLDCFA